MLPLVTQLWICCSRFCTIGNFPVTWNWSTGHRGNRAAPHCAGTRALAETSPNVPGKPGLPVVFMTLCSAWAPSDVWTILLKTGRTDFHTIFVSAQGRFPPPPVWPAPGSRCSTAALTTVLQVGWGKLVCQGSAPILWLHVPTLEISTFSDFRRCKWSWKKTKRGWFPLG